LQFALPVLVVGRIGLGGRPRDVHASRSIKDSATVPRKDRQ
jgi:hypothetical protein